MKRISIFLMFLALLFSVSAPAQVEMEEVGVLQDALKRAQQAFDAYKFPEAIELVNPTIQTLSQWEDAGRLQPEDEVLYEQCLELRGICEYNLGRLKAAESDFLRLIQLRPDYPFSRGKATKVKQFFESVRDKIAGELLLTISPEDSRVFIDGRLIGSDVPSKVPILKGLHTVKVVHPGFDPFEQEINIEVGESTPLTVSLVPNARTIYFFLQPRRAELYLDGRLAGKAVSPASSQENWSRYAQDNGMNPAGVFVVQLMYVSPGKHDIRIAKRCYKEKGFTIQVTLDTVYNQPGYVKPISIEEKKIPLEVLSHPSGADVYFDGDRYGVTPFSLDAFCIGEHDVLIEKKGVGAYSASVNISDRGTFKLDVKLRPTLLWVGMTRGSGVDVKQQKAAGQAVNDAFTKMQRFNGKISNEGNPVLPDTFFAEEVSSSLVTSTVEKLCGKYGCEGLVAGLIESNDADAGYKVRLVLLVPKLPGMDTFEMGVSEPSAAAEALKTIDSSPFEETSSALINMMDIDGFKEPVFLSDINSEGAPAIGDLLMSIDGTAPENAESALGYLRDSQQAVLRFSHAGKISSWTYKKQKRNRVLPYSGHLSDYRRRRLLSRQDLLGAEDQKSAVSAALNLAFADINLNRPGAVLEDIKLLKQEWSTPAVSYVKAVALIRLNRPEEARSILLSVAGDSNAVLDDFTGVLLKPLVVDLLKQLPPPPPAPPQTDGGN